MSFIYFPCLFLQSAAPDEHLPSVESVEAAKELDDVVARAEPLFPEVLLVSTKDIPCHVIRELTLHTKKYIECPFDGVHV